MIVHNVNNTCDGRFTLQDAVCGWIDPVDQMLLVTCTHYPWLDAEGKRLGLALFAEADDSFDFNISN